MSDVCRHTSVLLENKEIGATTYGRYSVTLPDVSDMGYRSISKVYSVACCSVATEMLHSKIGERSCVGFRAKQEDGSLLDSCLQTAKVMITAPQTLFEKVKNIRRMNLGEKFTLEIIYVDRGKLGDQKLFDEYVSFINEHYDYSTFGFQLMELVQDTEKFLNIHRALASDSFMTAPNAFDGEYSCKAEIEKYTRFPMKGKCDHMFVERWLADYSISPGEDASITYAQLISQARQRTCAVNKVSGNTHVMIEVIYPLGGRIFVPIRRHDSDVTYFISSIIKKNHLGPECLNGVSIIGIYVVEIPLFAPAKRAQSRLDFIRRTFLTPNMVFDQMAIEKKDPLQQIPQSGLGFFALVFFGFLVFFGTFGEKFLVRKIFGLLDEKTEKNGEKKLHLSDYCIIRSSFQKKSESMLMGSWVISPLDIFLQMAKHFTILDVAADLYAFIAYRLAQNTFSESLGAGANIFYEVLFDEKHYVSLSRHHAEFDPDMLAMDMFDEEYIKMREKIVVNVYLVDILDFGTNEEALKSLSDFALRMIKEHVEEATTPKTVVQPESNTIEAPVLHAESNTKNNPVRNAVYFCSMDERYFKSGSALAQKASIESISITESYRVVFTKTKVNTTKDRILLFGVELDGKISTDVVDVPLLLANICLDITKVNELFLWSQKKKKITIELFFGNTFLELTLKDNELWFANTVKEDMISQSDTNLESITQFHLQVNYRAAGKL